LPWPGRYLRESEFIFERLSKLIAAEAVIYTIIESTNIIARKSWILIARARGTQSTSSSTSVLMEGIGQDAMNVSMLAVAGRGP
jgi:hypothetical protein